MISYAQNFEDVILNRVFRDRQTGFYIDVGAMDPITASVTKHFYDLGWRGINVEPDERFYRKLMESRPRDINLNAALGNAVEKRPLYVFDEQGLATFNSSFRDYFTSRNFAGQEKLVVVTTLTAVCQQYATEPIDFLKIDAEGWEGPILEGAAWDTFRPLVILIESTEPFSHVQISSSWEPILLNADYEFVYFDGLNRFYLRRESSALKEAFQYPPNVLDGFTPWPEVNLSQVNQRLVHEVAALRAERDRLIENRETDRTLISALLKEKEETLARPPLPSFEAQSTSQETNQGVTRRPATTLRGLWDITRRYARSLAGRSNSNTV